MIFSTKNELTTFLDSYRNSDGSPNMPTFPSEEYASLLAEIDLPTHYTLPPLRPVFTIMVDETDKSVTPPAKGWDVKKEFTQRYTATVFNDKNEQLNKQFPILSEAYDWVHENFNVDVKIIGKLSLVDENNSDWDDEPPLFVVENRRIMFSNKDILNYYSHIYRYLEFLFLTEQYYENPNDFYTSYKWFKTHPAYWVWSDKIKTWDTNYENHKIRIYRFNDNQEIVYITGAGTSEEYDRKHRGLDLRLEVQAPSFEESYIKIAALTDKFFNLNGSERENVSHTPSELKKNLAKLVEEATETITLTSTPNWGKEKPGIKPDGTKPTS